MITCVGNLLQLQQFQVIWFCNLMCTSTHTHMQYLQQNLSILGAAHSGRPQCTAAPWKACRDAGEPKPGNPNQVHQEVCPPSFSGGTAQHRDTKAKVGTRRQIIIKLSKPHSQLLEPNSSGAEVAVTGSWQRVPANKDLSDLHAIYSNQISALPPS